MLFNTLYNDLAWLLISVLTVLRITWFINREEGPLKIGNKTRKAFYVMRMNKLVDCVHCLGFWVSIPVILVVYPVSARSILLVLAISGGVSLVEYVVNKTNNDSL